jgi:O-antigen ligase
MSKTIHRIALGLLPVGLCFWYTQTLVSHPVEKIYFLYTDGLLFLSDALALAAVVAWLFARKNDLPQSTPRKTEKNSLLSVFSVAKLALALCAIATVNIPWADDWCVALFVSLHLWLVLGLFLSIKDQPESWRALALGFCVALLVQIVIGFGQFALQTTAFLTLPGLEWPGQITPAMRGASVVQLADGARWLRVYGSFPHPNLLGGFTLMFLAGPAALLLFDEKPRPWALALLAGGAALLILTFSRSAWVGLLAAGLVVMLQRRKISGQRRLAAGLAVFTGLLSAAAPLHNLIFTRAGAGSVATEEFSNEGRAWLTGQALSMIQSHPFWGVGIGNFIIEYARHVPPGYLLEPVHNLPLLLLAELGIPGAVIGIGLGMVILRNVWRSTSPQSVLFGAMLIGLLVTSLFDHYLWTLAPGRVLLGLAFGLWASQVTVT